MGLQYTEGQHVWAINLVARPGRWRSFSLPTAIIDLPPDVGKPLVWSPVTNIDKISHNYLKLLHTETAGTIIIR